MAFDNLAVERAPTPFSNLMRSSSCTQKVFAFWFNRNQDSPNGGELTICGTDPSRYIGGITYIPLSVKKYWQFRVDKLMANGHTVSNGFQAIADTGTTLIIGTTNEIRNIYYYIGVPYQSGGGVRVDCNSAYSLPPVTFTIANTQFTLYAQDYIVTQNGHCFIGFADGNIEENLWILGDGKIGCLSCFPES